jgi:hypothetical protein
MQERLQHVEEAVQLQDRVVRVFGKEGLPTV